MYIKTLLLLYVKKKNVEKIQTLLYTKQDQRKLEQPKGYSINDYLNYFLAKHTVYSLRFVFFFFFSFLTSISFFFSHSCLLITRANSASSTSSHKWILDSGQRRRGGSAYCSFTSHTSHCSTFSQMSDYSQLLAAIFR